MGKFQEASKPDFAFPAELGDVRPIVAVHHYRTNGDDHDVDEKVPGSSRDTRFGQPPKVLLDRGEGCCRSHAFLGEWGRYPKNHRPVHLSKSRGLLIMAWSLTRSPWGQLTPEERDDYETSIRFGN